MGGATAKRLALFALIAAGIVAFFALDLSSLLTLENLKARREDLDLLLAEKPLLLIGGFFLFYVAVTALSLPGAAVMTIAAGAIFDLVLGTAIVSFASTIGASLAFLSSRYLLRDWVKSRFGDRVAAIDRGIERDGAFYLFTLRLIPAFPFFLINLAMGLTGMRLIVFYLVSQAGMFLGTIVFVNAGTQLARIERVGDILSPALIGSFVLLGIFPLIVKYLVGVWQRRRIYKGYRRPRRFDANLVVIGAGAGGLVSSLIAATVRAKVVLVEAREMGGDCLNTGCVPSKALLASAKAAHGARNAAEFGIATGKVSVDFKAVMARVQGAIAEIAPNDSVERYAGLGVDVRQGHARIVDPWTVEIDGKDRVSARAIIIAAGGAPAIPDIEGIEASGYLTSDTMWDALADRDEAPKRLLILGAGPIGCEMAQAFARLGSKVALVDHGKRVLPKEDKEVSSLLAEMLEAEGVDLRLGRKAVRFAGKTLIVTGGAGEEQIKFDEVIVAVGRKARLDGYGLEELGIDTSQGLIVNDRLETKFPNIYAVGDVAGPYQFTHFAAHQAWFASVNALFGTFRRFRADYSFLPWVTFTDPEIAHIGLTQASARSGKVAHEVVRYDLAHLDRAVAEGHQTGFVKLLVAPGKDRILGATIVGAGAGELLAEIALAMKNKLGLNKILGTIHAYPTMAEANKFAAGEWKKAHKPERLLAWVERWHRWRRG